jgi:hypothetical protein
MERYRGPTKRGKAQAKMERRNVAAATALAAYRVKVSTI